MLVVSSPPCGARRLPDEERLPGTAPRHGQISSVALLGRLRVPQFLLLYANLDEALGRAVVRPPYLRRELRLTPTATAPAAARRFVRRPCRPGRSAPWGNSEQAQLLAVELVTNAVIHARTDLRLRLELDGTVLHIAVCDLGLRLLRSVPDELEGEGGRGLRLVEGVATAWGWTTIPVAARSYGASRTP
jgi:Histidine kinase-like ATPase domain